MIKNRLISKLSLLIVISTIIAGCMNQGTYFSGDVVTIDQFKKQITLPAKEIFLGDEDDGRGIVCDSFLIFKSYRYSDYWFYVFNATTGRHITSFCPKGDGPDDFHDCDESVQLIDESGEKKIWIRDFQSHAKLINITRSIEERKTVCDSTINLSWASSFQYPPIDLFFLDEGQMLLMNQCEKNYIQDAEYIPRKFFLYKDSLENKIKEFKLFNKPVVCKNTKIKFPHFLFYASCNRIKPDKKKVAMAMRMISQISILDIESGELKGVQMKNSLTYPEIEEDIEKSRIYYTNMCVSESLIFAPYVNVVMKNSHAPFSTHVIHVFNWEGEAVCQINVKEDISSIFLDTERNILYAKDKDDKLYSYDVSTI